MCEADLTLLHVFSPSKAAMLSTEPLTPELKDPLRDTSSSLEAELRPWKEEAARLTECPVSLGLFRFGGQLDYAAFLTVNIGSNSAGLT